MIGRPRSPTLSPSTPLSRSHRDRVGLTAVLICLRNQGPFLGDRPHVALLPPVPERLERPEGLAQLVGYGQGLVGVPDQLRKRSEEHTSELQSLRHLV